MLPTTTQFAGATWPVPISVIVGSTPVVSSASSAAAIASASVTYGVSPIRATYCDTTRKLSEESAR